MKKLVKNLLFGAGIAAAGLAVYSLWKDAEKPAVVQNANNNSPSTTLPKEYVDRRRQQLRDSVKARKATQEEAAQEDATEGTAREKNVQEEAVQEGPAQEEALDTVPVGPAPSEQTTEKRGEL